MCEVILNKKQHIAFDTILSWCRNKVKTTQSFKPENSNQYIFLSRGGGGAGAGKSHLIKTIYHTAVKRYVTLHGKTGIKVIARSQHASTRKQKNLDLARLKRVQEHTSLLSSFVWLDTRRTKERAPTNNAVKQRSVLNL